MGQFLKCATCGEVFDSEEARQIANYVDDSGIVAFWTPACPFCGSEVYIENIADDSDDTYYMVQCKNDDKCGASSCFGECTKKEVIERWNNRAGAITVNNFGNGEQIKNEGHMTINIGGKNGS